MTFFEYVAAFFTNQIVIQAIGFLGMAVSIVSFQTKSYQKIIWLRVISEIIFAVQYFLLGAYTGMASNILSCVTNSVYRVRVKKNKSNKVCRIVFACMFVLVGGLTWQGMITVLVVLAKVLSTVANGMGKSKTIRYMNLGIMMLWNVHDVIVFSIAGVLCNMATILSILIAIFRIDRKKENAECAAREASRKTETSEA